MQWIVWVNNWFFFVWFFKIFLGDRWFSKILCNIWGWYVKILTIPYRGGWVVWKRAKTPLRNIKMAPNLDMFNQALFVQRLLIFSVLSKFYLEKCQWYYFAYKCNLYWTCLWSWSRTCLVCCFGWNVAAKHQKFCCCLDLVH